MARAETRSTVLACILGEWLTIVPCSLARDADAWSSSNRLRQASYSVCACASVPKSRWWYFSVNQHILGHEALFFSESVGPGFPPVPARRLRFESEDVPAVIQDDRVAGYASGQLCSAACKFPLSLASPYCDRHVQPISVLGRIHT